MTFKAELLEALGTATDSHDIRAAVRRCFFYDFDGYPVRLWHGVGPLQAGGYEWLGTIDADGNDYHNAPNVQTVRDGTSPRYTFGLPYLDRTTWTALKADQDLAIDRAMTCYHTIIKKGEGLRPSTALQFNYQLTMKLIEFSDSVQGTVGNSQKVYSASVMMRTDEVGRSRRPLGTYTDTAQIERARLLGVTGDSFCSMVSSNSRRTLTIEGI